MPRLLNRPPKLRRHASGQAFVSVSGKSIYLGKWGSPEARAAYRKFKGDWKPAPLVAMVSDRDLVSVAVLLDAFFTHAEKRYVKNGVQTSTLSVFATPIRVMRELFADLKIKDFGPLRLERARDEFVSQGVARVTANRYARLIIKIFRWGVSREMVDPSIVTALATLEPLRAGTTKARETQVVLPVSDADVDKTLPHLPPIVADMVRVQRLTGARPDEVCSMRSCDIERTGAVWVYRPKGHKLEHHGKARLVPIGPKAQAILAPYLLRAGDAYLFSPAEAVADLRARRHAARVTPEGYGNTIGTRRRRKPAVVAGERYDACSYRRAITRAAKKAGITPWAPNRLRHSMATEARRVGGLEVAQIVLGHSLRSTTERYAEVNIDGAADIIATIG
jgi:integrase